MLINTFINKRVEKLLNYMDEKQLDACIISSPENTFYYSNFNPIIGSHPVYVIITKEKKHLLLVHCIRNAHAQKESSLSKENILLYGKWGNNTPLALDPIEALKIILNKENLNIGLETKFASLNFVNQLKEKINFNSTYDISEFISHQRLIKDEYEISCLKKAAILTDIGVKTAIEYLKKGFSEAEACTEGQYQMRKYWHSNFSDCEVSGFGTSEGGQIDSFVVWSMANSRISYGCDCPIHYIPKEGDLVLPMSWARINGYSAENERTVIINKGNPLQEKAFKAVLEARNNIFNILKPGTTFEELYFAAKASFLKHGFEKILPGRVGHGLGLSTHEFPSLAPGNKMKLVPGMVFTIEPGLMDIEWGGVRHSDTVLITEKGFEFLTKLDRDLIIL